MLATESAEGVPVCCGACTEPDALARAAVNPADRRRFAHRSDAFQALEGAALLQKTADARIRTKPTTRSSTGTPSATCCCGSSRAQTVPRPIHPAAR